jgi:prepilin-type processing-associated H-X9-DG protein
VRLVRNYSLEGRMGGAGPGEKAQYGVADTSGVLGSAYPQYNKMTQIAQPGPAEAMTFVDESIQTLDDGYFAVNYSTEKTGWQNSPTVRHGNSGVLSFADGHAERWSWRALKVDQDLDTSATSPLNSMADLQRVQRAVLRDPTAGL